MTSDPSVAVRRWRGEAGVVLAAGDVEAVFLPEVGMLGASLRYRGEEFVSLQGGLAGYRRQRVTGIPLLAPWANRLSTRRFRVAGARVDLEGLNLPTDPGGLPIHGTMTAQHGWEVVRLGTRGGTASMQARFAYDDRRPDLLAAFPFPHELTVEVVVAASALRVGLTLNSLGGPVPVSFGWHPYFRLPGLPRQRWRLRMPASTHLELDDRGIPTGRSTPRPAEDATLGDRVFDDLFALGDDRRFALEGGGHRLGVRFDRNYPFAQIFAPAGSPFVAIEPMTAPTNAMVSGDHPLAQPGEAFTARFWILPASVADPHPADDS